MRHQNLPVLRKEMELQGTEIVAIGPFLKY